MSERGALMQMTPVNSVGSQMFTQSQTASETTVAPVSTVSKLPFFASTKLPSASVFGQYEGDASPEISTKSGLPVTTPGAMDISMTSELVIYMPVMAFDMLTIDCDMPVTSVMCT